MKRLRKGAERSPFCFWVAAKVGFESRVTAAATETNVVLLAIERRSRPKQHKHHPTTQYCRDANECEYPETVSSWNDDILVANNIEKAVTPKKRLETHYDCAARKNPKGTRHPAKPGAQDTETYQETQTEHPSAIEFNVLETARIRSPKSNDEPDKVDERITCKSANHDLG